MLFKFIDKIFGFFWGLILRTYYFKRLKVKGMFTFTGNLYVLNGYCYIGCKFSCRKGCNVNISQGELKIGSDVFFNNNVCINVRDSIEISSGVMIGNNVSIFDHDHAIKDGVVERDNFDCSSVFIDEDVWIGSNVVILKGVHIGKNSVISAGSVVTKNVPSGTIFIQKRTHFYKGIKDV